MFIAPVDATRGEDEWRSFVASHPFGHLVAPGGPGRDLPVVVPTQFVLEDERSGCISCAPTRCSPPWPRTHGCC